MILGIVLKTLVEPIESTRQQRTTQSAQQQAAHWLLTAGLFGFAGGLTNWLAVQVTHTGSPRITDMHARADDMLVRADALRPCVPPAGLERDPDSLQGDSPGG